MSDNVKHPNHYCKGGIECINAIKAAVSTITDPFEAYCTGNIIKYIWRWNDKNGIEDLHKAMQYIDFIEQHRANITATSDTAMEHETTSHRPTQAEYEELFTEDKPKGKYEGMSDHKLFRLICAPIAKCEDCPLFEASGGWGYDCETFEGFRKIAIEYLEGLEGKA